MITKPLPPQSMSNLPEALMHKVALFLPAKENYTSLALINKKWQQTLVNDASYLRAINEAYQNYPNQRLADSFSAQLLKTPSEDGILNYCNSPLLKKIRAFPGIFIQYESVQARLNEHSTSANNLLDLYYQQPTSYWREEFADLFKQAESLQSKYQTQTKLWLEAYNPIVGGDTFTPAWAADMRRFLDKAMLCLGWLSDTVFLATMFDYPTKSLAQIATILEDTKVTTTLTQRPIVLMLCTSVMAAFGVSREQLMNVFFTNAVTLKHIANFTPAQCFFVTEYSYLPSKNTLEKLLQIPAITQRLSGSDYLRLARDNPWSDGNNPEVGSSHATLILSCPEAIEALAKLPDEPIISLMKYQWGKATHLLAKNARLAEYMTGNRWIKLEKHSPSYRHTITTLPVIYNRFTKDDLRNYVLGDKFCSDEMDSLFTNPDITPRLQELFTQSEIDNFKQRTLISSETAEIIKQLRPKSVSLAQTPVLQITLPDTDHSLLQTAQPAYLTPTSYKPMDSVQPDCTAHSRSLKHPIPYTTPAIRQPFIPVPTVSHNLTKALLGFGLLFGLAGLTLLLAGAGAAISIPLFATAFGLSGSCIIAAGISALALRQSQSLNQNKLLTSPQTIQPIKTQQIILAKAIPSATNQPSSYISEAANRNVHL